MPAEISPAETGHAYLELHHLLHRLVDQRMTSAGLSLARAKVLARLDEHGPMNQATLAGLLGFAPRSVTDTVDALERDGLVTRAEDEHDRRARIIALTASGRATFHAAQAVHLQVMDEIFGSLTPADRARLAKVLTTIRSNLTSGEAPDCDP